jgi:hypothetical protein
MIRRRPAGGSTDAAPADAPVRAANDAPEGPPRKWHEFLSVRVVLFLLTMFVLMHLFLWKVVYDFWRDQNHARLRETVSEAWASLYRVVEHL